MINAAGNRKTLGCWGEVKVLRGMKFSGIEFALTAVADWIGHTVRELEYLFPHFLVSLWLIDLKTAVRGRLKSQRAA
jgi:hypothetical protein